MSTRALKQTMIVGALIACSLPVALTANAPSANALASYRINSGDGDTLRARLYEHANSSGAVLSYYGSAACSSTTADNDFSQSSMPSPHWWETWNDKVSSVQDFNGCDLKLYSDSNFGGFSWGYVNAGSGINVPSWMNDKASSFRVS